MRQFQGGHCYCDLPKSALRCVWDSPALWNLKVVEPWKAWEVSKMEAPFNSKKETRKKIKATESARDAQLQECIAIPEDLISQARVCTHTGQPGGPSQASVWHFLSCMKRISAQEAWEKPTEWLQSSFFCFVDFTGTLAPRSQSPGLCGSYHPVFRNIGPCFLLSASVLLASHPAMPHPNIDLFLWDSPIGT